MPLYEYHCDACGEDFSALLPLRHAGEAPACPACEARQVTRRLSLFAVGRGSARETIPLSARSTCACGGACGCSAQQA